MDRSVPAVVAVMMVVSEEAHSPDADDGFHDAGQGSKQPAVLSGSPGSPSVLREYYGYYGDTLLNYSSVLRGHVVITGTHYLIIRYYGDTLLNYSHQR